MTQDILFKVNDFVAEIIFNRPQKHNAMTPEMALALEDFCRQADRDDAVRVILLSGAGDRAFCAGSDLNSLAEFPDAWTFRNRSEYCTSIRNIKKPVVAALKGWVLGGGGEAALSADIRVAARSARFGFPEVTRGWVGGGGASQMLPRLIGYGQSMRLLLTGEAIDAEEAYRLGIFELLVDDADLHDRAMEICRKLAQFSPVAVQAVKASVRAALSMPLDSGIRYENEMNTLCFSAGDHMEGIKAFQEGRSAQFTR